MRRLASMEAALYVPVRNLIRLGLNEAQACSIIGLARCILYRRLGEKRRGEISHGSVLR
ncbi:hypothetical protein EMIT0196MI5_50077 [Pseudomonas sp. IT-196MI5]